MSNLFYLCNLSRLVVGGGRGTTDSSAKICLPGLAFSRPCLAKAIPFHILKSLFLPASPYYRLCLVSNN